MRVCVCVCVCMCQHVKQHRNHPPWGFGFLTPPGLDCNANLGKKNRSRWSGTIWEGFGKDLGNSLLKKTRFSEFIG